MSSPHPVLESLSNLSRCSCFLDNFPRKDYSKALKLLIPPKPLKRLVVAIDLVKLETASE